jgi:signal transduction histidine kinase
MKSAHALAAIRNRDIFITRLGDGVDRNARSIEEAMRRPPDEARLELRRLVRSLEEGAREVRWIGSGRLDTPRRRRVDLVRVVRQAATPWSKGLERRGSSLRIEAKPRKVVDLWDRMHLECIVGEMLSNASKHGAGKPVSVRIDATSHAVVLVFEDSGASPLPQRPFERFVRGPAATGEGMGVGLWLTHALAKQNGGGLRFRRSPTGGTQAVVRLARPRP